MHVYIYHILKSSFGQRSRIFLFQIKVMCPIWQWEVLHCFLDYSLLHFLLTCCETNVFQKGLSYLSIWIPTGSVRVKYFLIVLTHKWCKTKYMEERLTYREACCFIHHPKNESWIIHTNWDIILSASWPLYDIIFLYSLYVEQEMTFLLS